MLQMKWFPTSNLYQNKRPQANIPEWVYHMSGHHNRNWFRNLNLIYILLKIINALWIVFSIKSGGQKVIFLHMHDVVSLPNSSFKRLIIKCNLCCGKLLRFGERFWMSQFFTKLLHFQTNIQRQALIWLVAPQKTDNDMLARNN